MANMGFWLAGQPGSRIGPILPRSLYGSWEAWKPLSQKGNMGFWACWKAQIPYMPILPRFGRGIGLPRSHLSYMGSQRL